MASKWSKGTSETGVGVEEKDQEKAQDHPEDLLTLTQVTRHFQTPGTQFSPYLPAWAWLHLLYNYK